ncbi:SDR family oxidoreductase [Pseudomonas capeferrum]|uniref:SDR family NAD(P)-dependent oxidoreductase n=1 Tax=Pseudomonas capeferrum TaxID=1495066 RepID=UPI0015E30EAE|nr:SDR family NAD(P)-dependent oxidoreductase [Pseudomonas capeferrum]MBA1204319.1 SDR family oxidoreductase [Pseudomonas capeferrum]
MQLAGKRIVVTGGNRGIGAAVVKAFVEQGAQVINLDLAESAMVEGQGGGWARTRVCDISQRESVDSAFAWANEQLQGLDVLVHAAGIAPNARADAITLDDWESVFAVNARGTFLTNRAAYELLKSTGGRIINFASAAGVLGQPGKAHYAASKGAVLAWTRTVAREWGPLGITVNAIAPAMWTPMYEATRASMSAEQLQQHDAYMAGQVPIGGRLGEPARDLAPVLVFLAGDGSRFVTGQTLMIDGGMLMLS